MTRRIGLWLVGAFGGVGTTIAVGLAALRRGLTPMTGLVTAQPPFDTLDLPEPGNFIVGGHEIRQGSFAESVREFRHQSGIFDPELIAACHDDLADMSARVRRGTEFGVGPAIASFVTWKAVKPVRTAREEVDRIADDFATFITAEAIDHLIVLNVASTEPLFSLGDIHRDWDALDAALDNGSPEPLPASALYALAALQGGHTYINFTPSLGASVPALEQVARAAGALYAGKDGKSGETLVKTALAPIFALRNLEVLSWVSHNILGNRDGMVLDHRLNKASKVQTKDRVLTSILGYKPQTLVTIEYLSDMGDWKTAWDHVHFLGFLGTKMTMQFTWQGCDSLLAAPLAIDLARLADLERRRGGVGLMRHLASFFKSPEGLQEHDFFRQFALLTDYVAKARRPGP